MRGSIAPIPPYVLSQAEALVYRTQGPARWAKVAFAVSLTIQGSLAKGGVLRSSLGKPHIYAVRLMHRRQWRGSITPEPEACRQAKGGDECFASWW